MRRVITPEVWLPILLLGMGSAFASLRISGPVPHTPPPPPTIFARGGAELLRGAAPELVIDGLLPGEIVTVRAFRRVVQSRTVNERPAVDTTVYTSWARMRATRQGHLAVDSTTPLAGSWSSADPLGLFWSMTRDAGASTFAGAPGTVEIVLERGDVVSARLALPLRVSRVALTEHTVRNDSVAGAFAVPNDGATHPLVLLLHGSEGGDTTSALALARRFAARGYAALAVVYVSYGGVLPGVPVTFDAVPLELLDRARAWAGSRPNVDTSRTAIWGVSKGAEFAVLAAATRTWPKAVVACVPSDVVWAGFGREPKSGELLSSWSVGGRPSPSVQYDRYEDVFSGKATARAVHDRSRIANRAMVPGARIRIERATAPLLLLGAEADDVWASGEMSRSIGATLAAAGRRTQATVATYASAGHNICGDGTTPWELFGAGAFDRKATAQATADAWRRTVTFLDERLATGT